MKHFLSLSAASAAAAARSGRFAGNPIRSNRYKRRAEDMRLRGAKFNTRLKGVHLRVCC
jgi:hypothetical protein